MISYKSPLKSLKGYKTSKLAKSENSDCVVRAISSAFDITYNQAHKFAKDKYNRQNRKGTNTSTYYRVNSRFSSTGEKVFGKEVKEIGDVIRTSYFRINGENVEEEYLSPRVKRGSKTSKMTLGTFIKTYPKGTFILSVRGHSFTIKDGVVVGGNKSDSIKMRVIVKKAWQVL